MLKSFTGIFLALVLLGGVTLPASGKTITVPVHWSVQKNELSIVRMRLGVGRKLRKDVCAKYRNVLNEGHTFKVIYYGAGNVVLTTFTYTKRDC